MSSVVVATKIAHKVLFVEQMKQLAAVKLYCVDQKQSKVRGGQCGLIEHRGCSPPIPAEIVRLSLKEKTRCRERGAVHSLVGVAQYPPAKRPIRRCPEVRCKRLGVRP